MSTKRMRLGPLLGAVVVVVAGLFAAMAYAGTTGKITGTIQEKGKEIFQHILKIASGERSKSEKLGYGDAEFVPWQIGATM